MCLCSIPVFEAFTMWQLLANIWHVQYKGPVEYMKSHLINDICLKLERSWWRLHSSWIYNYLCNQCLSPLNCEFESLSWRGVLDTMLCCKVCQWLPTGRWFSPCTSVSSTNKTDRHDITEILLKVALNTITLTPD